LAFSVFHLTEMLLNLKKYYAAAHRGEDILTKRLITSPAKTTQEIKEAYSSLPADDQP
jgi:predicted adenine nucleotide alpha hydrolase (AANH) superfamily ATPase